MIPTLYLTVGLPASGKSSYAKGRVTSDSKLHRYNYDEFRAMMFNNSYRDVKNEAVVRLVCRNAVIESLRCGFSVVVDNTALTERAQESWRNLAKEERVKFEIVDFRKVSVDTCINRDKLRQGHAHVSAPVIWNMALKSGLMKFDERPIVIVDVDGTLADHEGIRSPYDEHKVHLDTPHEVIVKWVNNLTSWGDYCLKCFKSWRTDEYTPIDPCTCQESSPAPDYQVVIVSGRSTLCSVSTYNWLASRIQFSAIFMRNRGDRRPDVQVKQEILNRILSVVPKEQIKFVLDDRPCVVRMWKENGLTVYPVRGAVEEF
jgi:predicted kinase